MTSKRAEAYGRAIRTLESLGRGKLHGEEQDTIRETADALFFCDDLEGDSAAQGALDAFHALIDRLLESERLMPETAHRLTAQIEDCGPIVGVV